MIHLLSISWHPQGPRDHETVFRRVPFPFNTPHNETQHNTLSHLLPATTKPRIRSKTYSILSPKALPSPESPAVSQLPLLTTHPRIQPYRPVFLAVLLVPTF